MGGGEGKLDYLIFIAIWFILLSAHGAQAISQELPLTLGGIKVTEHGLHPKEPQGTVASAPHI